MEAFVALKRMISGLGTIGLACILVLCSWGTSRAWGMSFSLTATNIESGTILFLTDGTQGQEAVYFRPPAGSWRGFDVVLDSDIALVDAVPDVEGGTLMIYAGNDPVANADLDGHLFDPKNDGSLTLGVPVSLRRQGGGSVIEPIPVAQFQRRSERHASRS